MAFGLCQRGHFASHFYDRLTLAGERLTAQSGGALGFRGGEQSSFAFSHLRVPRLPCSAGLPHLFGHFPAGFLWGSLGSPVVNYVCLILGNRICGFPQRQLGLKQVSLGPPLRLGSLVLKTLIEDTREGPANGLDLGLDRR